MNFNDKFLNVCFKVGKIILSILLIVFVCAVFIMIGNIAITSLSMNKIKNTKIEYVYPNTMINAEIVEESTEELPEISVSEVYGTDISAALKNNNMSQNLKEYVIETIQKVDRKDQQEFVNHLSEYCKNRKKDLLESVIDDYASSYGLSTQYVRNYISNNSSMKYEIDKRVIDLYYSRYSEQQNYKKEQVKSLESRRLFQIYILLGLIYSFILVLIIPLLIRIEENTRK